MTVLQLEKTVASIRWLAAPTSWSWLEEANGHLDHLLIDHAHCERKAAGSAVQMMFRYLCEPGLAEALSPIAQEELEHFDRVLAVVKQRGRYLEPLPSPDYGARLAKAIRKGEPNRMLDSFLVAGLILEIGTLWQDNCHMMAREILLMEQLVRLIVKIPLYGPWLMAHSWLVLALKIL